MTPYYSDASGINLRLGDCRSILVALPESSIDACVTDPPYELGFMGKRWDASGIAFDPAMWSEVARVLKPGAYLLAFGGTRTFHRMTSAIEDAGFEVRDCLSWLYGSGFPKSLNLGDGRGTALKPAWEPCVLARKPLKGTVAENVAAHGTGALNVDACRLGDGCDKGDWPVTSRRHADVAFTLAPVVTDTSVGRWPANVLLDEQAAALLDEMSGESVSPPVGSMGGGSNKHAICGDFAGLPHSNGYGDSGGASRFFYVAKPSREERDMGCEGLTQRQRDDSRKVGDPGGDNPRNRGAQARGNFHPTVKPIELMRWLVRLVTPIGGTVLDPFMGSGTTGCACVYEQRGFIGIEREADYIEIARRRIAAVAPLFTTPESTQSSDAVDPSASSSGKRTTRDGQGSLLESA